MAWAWHRTSPVLNEGHPSLYLGCSPQLVFLRLDHHDYIDYEHWPWPRFSHSKLQEFHSAAKAFDQGRLEQDLNILLEAMKEKESMIQLIVWHSRLQRETV